MAHPLDTAIEFAVDGMPGHGSFVVTARGATLRSLSVDGVDLVEPYPAGTGPVWCQGEVLIPWPNRIRDGRWVADGVIHQLELTEPELGNAIHGLVRRMPHDLVERRADSVTLAVRLEPVPGYPFTLYCSTEYRSVLGGVEVVHTVRNEGDASAPVAVGVHPYWRIGDVPTEELVLTIRARTHISVDERLNPTGLEPMPERLDCRGGRRVGDLQADDAFTDLWAANGQVEHTLDAPDGRRLTVWAQERFGYVQVFTTAQFPAVGGPRPAVAVEPMTAPADAFTTGHGTEWVRPGQEWSVRWGASLAPLP